MTIRREAYNTTVFLTDGRSVYLVHNNANQIVFERDFYSQFPVGYEYSWFHSGGNDSATWGTVTSVGVVGRSLDARVTDPWFIIREFTEGEWEANSQMLYITNKENARYYRPYVEAAIAKEKETGKNWFTKMSGREKTLTVAVAGGLTAATISFFKSSGKKEGL